MERPPRQPSEGSHSVPLQRLADVALRVERELVQLQDDRSVNDFYKAKKTTEAVIDLARAVRALFEWYG
jgi:hypothetical protein